MDSMEGSSNSTKVPDEFLTKIGETQKLLQFLSVRGNRPITHSTHLLQIHLDVIFGDHIPQKRDSFPVELTLLSFDVKMMFE